MRYSLVVAAGLLASAPSLGAAQTEPATGKAAFCQEALDLAADLLTGSAVVIAATAMDGFEETGEMTPSDPRVGEAVTSMVDAANAISKQLVEYCRG